MAGRRQEAVQGVREASTMPASDWKPSRFFDAWKEEVDTAKGWLVLQYMHYCRGMPTNIRQDAIDYVLRGTMPRVYRADDTSEAFDAMDNDIDEMREYAGQFIDEFWAEYWKEFLASHLADAGPATDA